MTLARLTHARGIQGEVAADPMGSSAKRFSQVRRVFLRSPSGEIREVGLKRVWEHQSALIFQFEGIETRSDAETLKGMEVCLPISEREPLDAGEHYHADLIGCRVEDAAGREVGLVQAVITTGGVDLLELTNGLLVPFTSAICGDIDPVAGRIVVNLPEGLEDLNHR